MPLSKQFTKQLKTNNNEKDIQNNGILKIREGGN